MTHVFVISFGGKPVAVYSNEEAAQIHCDALYYHPDTPNRSWVSMIGLPLLERYRLTVEAQNSYDECAKVCRQWAKEHTADAFPEVRETLLALAVEMESMAG